MTNLKDLIPEGVDLTDYQQTITKWIPKKIGKWSFSMDRMTGTWEWNKSGPVGPGRPTVVFATLFWEGEENLPIDIMDEDGNGIGDTPQNMAFKTSWSQR